jgi:HAE1 family hydrophobic/amphiphilic exporter-1
MSTPEKSETSETSETSFSWSEYNPLVLFSLQKPTTILMVCCALFVLGYISYMKIRVELLPQGLEALFLGVFVPYYNSNPSIIEEQITKPLEEHFSTIHGLQRIRSVSSSENSDIDLEFASGTNMKVAYAQVQDRLDRARLEFPEEVGQEHIWKFSMDDTPILFLGISIEDSINDPFYLIENYIKSNLTRLEGVARVSIFGMYEKMIRIDLDKEKVRKHRINIYELNQFLRKNNLALPLGNLKEADKKYFVRSMGHFQSLQEIEDLKIKDNLRLKDIATVRYGFARKDFITRIDGKQSFYCALYKESSGNTVDVCQAVKTYLEKEFVEDPQLEGFQCHILWSQGKVIESSLNNLKETLYSGAFLAMVVLLIFLRRIRMTLLIVLSIPISLLVALIYMYFNGDTLNLLTMMGMTLGVGMLVDNTVVVVENIDRLKQQGMSALTASLKGTSEVGLAVTSSTATTLVVFLPLMLMNDNAEFQFFMTKLGTPVCVSLTASLIVALIFIPLATCYIEPKPVLKPKEDTPKENFFSRLFKKISRWIILHRLDSTVLLSLLLASTYYPYTSMKDSDESQNRSRRLHLDLNVPKHFSLSEVHEVFLQYESLLTAHKEELEILHILSRFQEAKGSIRLFLKEAEDSQVPLKEITEKLKKILPKLPGVQCSINWESESQSQQIDIHLIGPDTATLGKIAEAVKERLQLIPELESIEINKEDSSEEIHLHLDRQLAFDLGVAPDIVLGTLTYALRGSRLADFKGSDREIPMAIQYREEDAEPLQLKNMKIFSNKGIEVPLSSFSHYTITQGPSQIRRNDHRTSLKITAIPSEGSFMEIKAKIDFLMSQLSLPRGYALDHGDRFKKQEENNSAMLFTFLMSVLFVFLLMGILFESFVLPFSILTSIPFALMGVYWSLYLTNTPFEVMSGIGLVILAGVVVNNAIVLVDCINRLRKEGYDRTEAIVLSGVLRLRPILITAITTIVGLIPMAMGQSHIVGTPYYPLGRTVIGGMVASTLLTLLVVPLFYSFCDDLRLCLLQVTSRLFSSPKKASASS